METNVSVFSSKALLCNVPRKESLIYLKLENLKMQGNSKNIATFFSISIVLSLETTC